MIFNLLRNAIVALLLHAGAAVAFNGEPDAPAAETSAAPAQSCALPVQLSADTTNAPATLAVATGAHS